MQITIFKDLTTEDALQAIEKESLKYEGLYVEMNNKEERKFVKDSAALINNILKKLERARIDKNVERKSEVELEAKSIKERLDVANKPLIDLIDAHKEERVKALAKEKEIQEAKDLIIQIEEDHGDAITLDKMRTFEIQDAIRQQKERDEQIAREASAKAELEKEQAEERAEQAEKDKILAEAKAKRDAEQAEINRLEAEKQAKIRAEQAAENAKQGEIKRQINLNAVLEEEKAKLEANKKHVGSVLGEIKEHLIKSCKIDEVLAVKIVKALLKTKRITINY